LNSSTANSRRSLATAADLVLGPHHLGHHALPQDDQRSPGADVDVWHVHRRDHVQQQQLGQLVRIDAIVLAFAPVDQPQLRRVGDGHVCGQRADRFVEMAVAAGGLVANAKGLIELAQSIDHGRAWAFELKLIDDAAAGVENAQ
jgi:hypothetical protein